MKTKYRAKLIGKLLIEGTLLLLSILVTSMLFAMVAMTFMCFDIPNYKWLLVFMGGGLGYILYCLLSFDMEYLFKKLLKHINLENFTAISVVLGFNITVDMALQDTMAYENIFLNCIIGMLSLLFFVGTKNYYKKNQSI